LIDGILQSVRSSGEPVVLENLSSGSFINGGVQALMAVPLCVPDQPVIGALLVANRRARAFGHRQLSILNTIANQAAWVVQSIFLATQLEFRTIMDERTRLAREIHDGLAQTLGFLKLKTAQLRGFMDKGQMDLARQTANTCYDVLAEAYQETRRSIDGLRISPGIDGIAGWLRQTVADFEDYSGVKVEVCTPEAPIDLAPEVHAQMIRIVQEALSNVRKHAQADLVEITCREQDGAVLLEIRDNGMGFDAGDITNPSQHGLRGMRERAELIGADFQVTSQPHRGTRVSVRLPDEVRERG
jgi:two-component system nitrate/nitrite sensor histidine kinase NarX